MFGAEPEIWTWLQPQQDGVGIPSARVYHIYMKALEQGRPTRTINHYWRTNQDEVCSGWNHFAATQSRASEWFVYILTAKSMVVSAYTDFDLFYHPFSYQEEGTLLP